MSARDMQSNAQERDTDGVTQVAVRLRTWNLKYAFSALEAFPFPQGDIIRISLGNPTCRQWENFVLVRSEYAGRVPVSYYPPFHAEPSNGSGRSGPFVIGLRL